MTTFEPTVAQFLLTKVGRAITARKEARESSTHAGTWLVQTMRLMLHLAGFGCLTYAGFEWSTIAGFVVAGLSFFVLSNLSTTRSAQRPQSTDPMANRRQ